MCVSVLLFGEIDKLYELVSLRWRVCVITVPVLAHTDQFKMRHSRWLRLQMFSDPIQVSDFYEVFRL
jgi:hypothetical protein